jgi:hypothetical protein
VGLICSFIDSQHAVGQDFCPKSAASFEGFVSAFVKSLIHPITGSRFARAEKPDTLDIEFGVDQIVEIDSLDDDISPERVRFFVEHPEGIAEKFVDFLREEGDLAFVILLVVKEAVTPDSPAGNAFDFRNFLDGRITGRLLVMAVIIVIGRNVEAPDFHGESKTRMLDSWRSFASQRST